MSDKDEKNRGPRQSIESAEELYENAPCGYVSFLPDGTIFNINETLLSWLKFSREEVLEKKKFNSLFKIGGQIFFETHFFPLIKMQGFVKEINFDLVRKDGTTFPGLLNVNEVSLDPQAPKSYRATIFDISDRKIYERELLLAKKLAEKASEARADFLATVSHEIRTPLNAILGISNLLRDTNLDKQQKEYSEILLRSSENLLGLVNNLLDLSKIEADKIILEKKPFNLCELLESLLTTFEVRAHQKNIELLQDLPEDLPTYLLGDPVKLNQILTNLLGNAIKFTEQGHVELKVSIVEKQEEQVKLRFLVNDTGIGIPEEKLQLIFEEFTQASYEVSRNYGGTGLGLNISQKLLKLYNSEIEVSSEPGKGSAFFFDLDMELDAEMAASAKNINKEKSAHLFDAAHILVVDDNPVNVFVVSEFLEQWNLKYDAAENGQQAIEAVKQQTYDLVLMDLHMPGIDGYDTSREIRKLDLEKQPVIIALSASGRGDLNVKQRRAGINDYVPKPFQPEELFEALAHHLEILKSETHEIIPKEASEEHHEGSEDSSTTDQDASYNLSRLIKMANRNAEFLQKFISNTTIAFEDYAKDFEAAAAKKDPEQIGALLHKATMSIYYIRANRLTSLLEEAMEFFADDHVSKASVKEKISEVKAEFDHIVRGLKKVKPQLLVKE